MWKQVAIKRFSKHFGNHFLNHLPTHMSLRNSKIVPFLKKAKKGEKCNKIARLQRKKGWSKRGVAKKWPMNLLVCIFDKVLKKWMTRWFFPHPALFSNFCINHYVIKRQSMLWSRKNARIFKWFYEDIVSPKIQQNYFKDFCPII